MNEVLRIRTISAIVFAIIVVGLVFTSKSTNLLLFGLIAAGASYELAYMATKSAVKSWLAVGLALIPFIGLFFSPQVSSDHLLPIILICCGLHGLLIGFMHYQIKIPYEKLMPMFVWAYPVVALFLMATYLKANPFNPRFIMAILALIWVNDSFAYLIGSRIGKTKLYERISPKKTWEGTIGGALLTLPAAYLCHQLVPSFSLSFWVLAALVAGILGTLGDLLESSIKRQYEVKDSGNIMPGHGGIFDRFDSFIFVLPFVLALIYLV